MGGAKVQNTANPVQRGSTSANNGNGACATITAGQHSFQVNCSVCIFFFFFCNVLSQDIHTSRIPSHVPPCGHLLHRYSLIHSQLGIIIDCYSTDLSGCLH